MFENGDCVAILFPQETRNIEVFSKVLACSTLKFELYKNVLHFENFATKLSSRNVSHLGNSDLPVCVQMTVFVSNMQ
jgi:hypothetical protein